MISLKVLATPANIERLQTRGPQIIEAVLLKMDQLMIRLHRKIINEALPRYFKTQKRISQAVEYIPAEVSGTKIGGFVGLADSPAVQSRTLKSGAVVNWAAVQEAGGRAAYTIEPFPPKKALAFMLDGKKIITKRVFHPPLPSRPFMRAPLGEMEDEIVAGLNQAVKDAIA